MTESSSSSPPPPAVVAGTAADDEETMTVRCGFDDNVNQILGIPAAVAANNCHQNILLVPPVHHQMCCKDEVVFVTPNIPMILFGGMAAITAILVIVFFLMLIPFGSIFGALFGIVKSCFRFIFTTASSSSKSGANDGASSAMLLFDDASSLASFKEKLDASAMRAQIKTTKLALLQKNLNQVIGLKQHLSVIRDLANEL